MPATFQSFAGVVGLWGIGFFSYDLLQSVLQKQFQADPHLTEADVRFKVGITYAVTFVHAGNAPLTQWLSVERQGVTLRDPPARR